MSSILKALKKLEEEKSVRRPESLNIDTEILRGRPVRKVNKSGIVLSAILLFLCGAAASYFGMKQKTPNSPLPLTTRSAPTSSTTETGTIVVVHPSAPPLDTPMNKQGPESRQQSSFPALNQSIPAQKSSINQLSPPAPVQKTIQNETFIESMQHKNRIETLPVRPSKSAPSTPQLTVNGIAFQEEGADNVAVVNGISVMKGSVVEGVTVVEILKDRVRFGIGSEMVDVGLGRSNKQ